MNVPILGKAEVRSSILRGSTTSQRLSDRPEAPAGRQQANSKQCDEICRRFALAPLAASHPDTHRIAEIESPANASSAAICTSATPNNVPDWHQSLLGNSPVARHCRRRIPGAFQFHV